MTSDTFIFKVILVPLIEVIKSKWCLKYFKMKHKCSAVEYRWIGSMVRIGSMVFFYFMNKNMQC